MLLKYISETSEKIGDIYNNFKRKTKFLIHKKEPTLFQEKL